LAPIQGKSFVILTETILWFGTRAVPGQPWQFPARRDHSNMTTVIFYRGTPMTETVSKSKFKPMALEYFRRVQETGEEIVITDRGKPVVKIVPAHEEPAVTATILEKLRGTLIRYEDPFAPVGVEDWEMMK
jgi:prevent-host-death family protein